MASVFQRAVKYLSDIENVILKSLYFRFPPEAFAPALVTLPNQLPNYHQERSLLDVLKDSFLWAVPKKRRSIEKRRSRRFGHPMYVWKPLVPKTNILICDDCGSYYEANRLCPSCYANVKEVTQEMQEAIQKNLGYSPVENEVVVLYANEERANNEFYMGKRIVEIKKEKPSIFCNNLLQKSTQAPATTSEVIEKKEMS